jgi:site-specific recombinase XerD
MLIDERLDKVRTDFLVHLTSLGLSGKSHKNYKSDLNHFSAWVILKIRAYGSLAESLTDAVPFLGSNLAGEYKNYLTKNLTPVRTVNRRLSTLRHLSRYLVLSRIIDSDFMDKIANVSDGKVGKPKTHHAVVNEFRTYLEEEKVSPNTLKNYLSDIRQFLEWIETNRQSETTDH